MTRWSKIFARRATWAGRHHHWNSTADVLAWSDAHFLYKSSTAAYRFAEAERLRTTKLLVVCATGQSSLHTMRRAQEARIALCSGRAPPCRGRACQCRRRSARAQVLRALRCCARSRTTAAWSASGRSTPSCSRRCAARTVRARLVPSLARLPATCRSGSRGPRLTLRLRRS